MGMRGLWWLSATLVVAGAVTLAACGEIEAGPGGIASIGLDRPVFPSIVAGDSLRDSLGVAQPLTGSAYGEDGEVLPGITVKFRSPGDVVDVDSLTGFVVAGAITTTTPFRVLAEANGLQTGPVQMYIVPAPNLLNVVDNGRDTLEYSLSDTSANVSAPLRVRLFRKNSSTDSVAIRAYLVNYSIESPTDPELARLVSDDRRRTSGVDTTDVSGEAGRSVLLRPIRLTAVEDSIVVRASVKYLGTHVPGSPVRLVLLVKPKL